MKAQASAAGKRVPASLQTKSSSALISLAVSFHLTMTKQQANWYLYDNNGGSCVAIAGADYCVITAGTRMSTGYNILTCDYSKICKLADKCVMASSGFQADVRALQKHLAARHLIYQHQHNKQERVGSYPNVSDVVLGGDGTGSDGGSTSSSIMHRMAAKRRRSQTC
ncbi:proteasome subunit beta type-1-like [Vitis riparia]|uniref:proteasome subunit beta type-1-like n=1 Tax=Vitis riparia TaxID=96939 RepID=UPI00155B0099|nr:proteasome subunit beta type-1-like [Vitis riparia]